MNTSNAQSYGPVWAIPYIDSHPIPVVRKDLLPWLIKDRRQAEVGAMIKVTNKDGKTETTHNKEGLEYAERELRRIVTALNGEPHGTDRHTILSNQKEGQEERVSFWRGKIYLLDKTISETQRRAGSD